ncbi:MAG TPA: hypothetical protein VF145_02045 [Chitinophagaceae bacterium]
MIPAVQTCQPWNTGRKILFRFFFIYWILFIAPWTWFSVIPGIDWLMQYYYQALDWLVGFMNGQLFHIREQLVPINGSGDTSFGWAQVCTLLLIAACGTVAWTVIDRKKEYVRLHYWLCLIVRYNIALVCFLYGFIKVFHLQMPFPSYSQLATPLGDLLPMRLSWMFMGYSHLYQGFSGALEVLAGLLLLYRRTTTLGSLLAAGIFLNVAMMNLGYDIPVKIFSIHVFLMCAYLLVIEHRRLIDFFILNRAAAPSVLYQYTPSKRWMKAGKNVLKLAMIVLGLGFNLYNSYNWYQSDATNKTLPPLQAGLYDVTSFVLNGDTVPPLLNDTLRWQNIAIEQNNLGSVGAIDTSLWLRYNRSYFSYEPDTANHAIVFKKSQGTGDIACRFSYEQLDSSSFSLRGRRGKDSLFIVLKRSKRSFPLAERQFHWLSERNR